MAQEGRLTCGSLAETVDARTGRPCERSWVANTTLHEEDAAWLGPGAVPLIYADSGKFAFCVVCGARLSFGPDGTPVAEAMVPMAEVARLELVLGHAGELAAEEAGARDAFAYAEAFKVTARHLAAAEEASDGTGGAGR